MAIFSKLINQSGKSYYVVLQNKKANEAFYSIKVNKLDTVVEKVYGEWVVKGVSSKLSQYINRLLK